MFDAAEAAGRRCVEGLMYRHHPQTVLARRLVADGAVGQLTLVRAALTVNVPAGDIRRVKALGGGAHLDLGCYCVSAIRLFGGEPEHVYATAVPDADGCDLRMAATLGLPGGVLGQLDIGLDLTRRDQLELVGTGGRLVVPDPWICRGAELELWRNGTREAIPVDLAAAGLDAGEDAVYRLELDRVSEAIATGEPLEFGRADAVAQAATLEALRVSSERGVVVTP